MIAQLFRLCMVLILIQHGRKIRRPAKNIVCTHFYGLSKFCSTISDTLPQPLCYSPPQRFPISVNDRNGRVQCVFIIARAAADGPGTIETGQKKEREPLPE